MEKKRDRDRVRDRVREREGGKEMKMLAKDRAIKVVCERLSG